MVNLPQVFGILPCLGPICLWQNGSEAVSEECHPVALPSHHGDEACDDLFEGLELERGTD